MGDSVTASCGSRKTVFLIDDHPLVCTGLASLINQEHDLVVCGQAGGEANVLQMMDAAQPDVALVDWSLKGNDASCLIMALRRRLPKMPVLVLSVYDEMIYAERALRAGASGYIMKSEATEKIGDAIHAVLAGQLWFSERLSKRMLLDGADRGGEGSAVPPAHTTIADRLRLSIVIPVYNSERTIARLCEQLILELGEGYHLQIVLVDDNSTDGSARVCRVVHDRYPEQVDCIVLSRNFGEHNAVMAGLNYADGDYCVIMDDDFQNPPAEVHRLVAEAGKGNDVVYVRYDSKRHSYCRNLGSRFHNWMATRALGKPSGLYLSSFKIVSQFLVQEIVRYTGPDPYIDAIILRTTRKIGVVPSQHEPRQTGKSGYTFGKLVALWGNMIVSFSLFPLRLLGALGAVMLLVGTGVGLFTLVSLVVPGWEDPDSIQRLNASNWFFRGVTLVAVGIVGEYVGRIYMHLNREPQFIVRSMVRRRA